MATSENQSVSEVPSGGPSEVSANVARDLVHYIRSNTIRNEQQSLLFVYSYVSGYQNDPGDYLSSIGIGTSSSGKTHVKDKVDDLWEIVESDLYKATSGTDKSLIYDDELDESMILSMNELNQISDELVEFMKGIHGGDEEFVYKTTTGSVRDGFSTEEIVKEAKPYVFLYAQYEPDFELWNRLLKIPVHESESKNVAVGAMAFDHQHISLGDESIEYGYDFDTGTYTLQKHIARISAKAPFEVVLPTSEEHGWDVWEIVQPIFNPARSEVNRVYKMVASMIRASTVLNFHNREVLDDSEGVTTLLAEPQDVANVLACREVLLASTHEIDAKKRAICNAIAKKGGKLGEVEGVGPIRDFIAESDAPAVKKSELKHLLEDLQDNYLIDIHEGVGDKGKDVYEFLGWDELGFARVQENAELFRDCVDPITGDPYVEAHKRMKDELNTDASDLLKQASSSSSRKSSSVSTSGGGSSTQQSGNAGLGAYGGGSPDNEATIELDPVEQALADRAAGALDGVRIKDLRDVPVEAFLGIVPLDDPDSTLDDLNGTLLDTDHRLWAQPDKPDDWVTTQQEARRQIKRAVRRLIDKNVIQFDEIHEEADDGTPVDATLQVVLPGS